MGRYTFLPVTLMLLFVSTGGLLAGCSVAQTSSMPPTPTPIPGGSHFFDPLRVSTETKAIEVRVVNCSGRVPMVESAIMITEPTTVRAITTTLLSAVSTAPSTDPPAVRQSDGYMVTLYLYNRDDVLPQSGTSGPWLLARVDYNYEAGVVNVYRPDAQGQKIEFYPVAPELRDILEREMAVRGLTLPH